MKNNGNIIHKIKNFFINYQEIIFLILPFAFLDFSLQMLGSEIFYFPLFLLMPSLFTAIWLFLIISICLNLNKKIGISLYIFFLAITFVLFLTNGVYYSTTDNFFEFSLLGLASEGQSYIIDAIKNTNIWVYVSVIIFVFLAVIGIKIFPNTKTNYKNIGVSILIFLAIHTFLPLLYGPSNQELSWNTWKNAKNVYLRFNDSNKSFSITGLYEYSFRNFYLTYLKSKETANETELEFLNQEFSYVEAGSTNAYTGLFKNNNVIFVQLEGIDDWLVTEETMPTLYSMLDNSINFTNHYSFYNGGGSTFNSEFAVNTGFITPITYNRNAYTFNKNTFTYSMANLFKNEGYRVDAFHMNTREYYSRGINYDNWGYDNYYSLKDQNSYSDLSYQLDTELIKNEDFYNSMFKQEGLFVNYLISYSNHMPFSTKNGVCKQLLNLDLENNLIVEEQIKLMTEEDCIKRQARETDDMLALILLALEENNLADNTILVIFSDHYLYTVNDKNILDSYKETDNNLINHTPFLIYKKNLKKVNVTDVTSQVDILPTVLNLFGINYIKDYYLGNDALDKNYEGLVFFNDYSWYDSNCYVEDGIIKNNCSITKERLIEKNNYVNYIIQKNDFTLKYDYFAKLKKKSPRAF
ncbi:MAG: sulfatase-like hydrolase/transferase [Bacilli bacterium]|nr:sulfatase-like hydrolase/transferase [Bacilli bacterium]